MEIVQEYSITQAGSLTVNLNDDYQILQAVTIGSSSKLRAVVDVSKPTNPVTFTVVAVGAPLGGNARNRIWYGSINLNGQTYDVFLIVS